jgi:uracil-DNA glycosylase
MNLYEKCSKCNEKDVNFEPIPYYETGQNNKIKIMIIGQDPTISNRANQHLVTIPLKFNKNREPLRKYINEIFGEKNINNSYIFVTNTIKCILKVFPGSFQKDDRLDYLHNIFICCKENLEKEIDLFKPNYIFTLGEPCHQLFYFMVKNLNNPKETKFGDFFTGDLCSLSFNGITFLYSPIPHLNQYNDIKNGNSYNTQKYGKTMKIFINNIKNIFI